ncbi:MAG: MFS transporter [Acetobacteraceae bacterium]|nr:MFS transporter [Acetobacteraceae bacterium]
MIIAVLRVAGGNFLEMYDFFVFAYYAAAIGRTFFPNGSEFASLMAALMTFGAGFLMRPLGAIFLGAYTDRKGRRKGLILTLAVMSIGTLTIALVPGYETIGLFAPLIIVVGRLLQGFSAGAELGGVSVYLSEIATPGNKGFYVSWQSASQQVAVILVAVLGVGLSLALPPETMTHWGWRIPFLIGCMILPFVFLLRRSLVETEAFLARKHHPTPAEIFATMVRNWRIIILGMLLVTMTSVSFYLITAYTPTFGREVLKLQQLDVLVVTLCVAISNLIWIPIAGAVSDRIGRRPLLIGSTVLTLLTAYPVMSWLIAAPSFTHLLMAELWLSFIYAVYNGAIIVYLTEIMPASVRTTAFSFAYNLATATFGGFTPAICTALIHVTGNRALPGAWMSFAALLSLIATLLVARRQAEAAEIA